MIKITKSQCPKRLLKYARHEPLDINEPFKDREVKEIIKNSLLKEQRYICAYCMTRITFEKMVIEHIEPKSNSKKLARTYSNLLATCNNSDNHCDKSKEDKKLLIANPLTLFDENENAINYLRDGSIELESGTPLYEDISVTLNLMCVAPLFPSP